MLSALVTREKLKSIDLTIPQIMHENCPLTVFPIINNRIFCRLSDNKLYIEIYIKLDNRIIMTSSFICLNQTLSKVPYIVGRI